MDRPAGAELDAGGAGNASERRGQLGILSFFTLRWNWRYCRHAGDDRLIAASTAAGLGRDLVNRTSGIDDHNSVGPPRGFGKKPLAHPLVEIDALLLHAVELPPDSGGRLAGRQIEDDRQVGHQVSGGDPAHFPEHFHVEAAAISLVNHVGEQVAVADDGLPRSSGGRMISSTNWLLAAI